MRKLAALLVFAVATSLAGFATHVAIHGADRPMPPPGEALEGTLGGGALTDSPVGEAVLAAVVTLTEARGEQGGLGPVEYESFVGSLEVDVVTDAGTEHVRLPTPGRWRTLPDAMEVEVYESVAGRPGLPEMATVEEHLSPPYRVAVLALRPGMPIIVERDGDGEAIRAWIGEREIHVQHDGARGAMVFPVVLLFGLMAVVTYAGAWVLFRSSAPADGQSIAPPSLEA